MNAHVKAVPYGKVEWVHDDGLTVADGAAQPLGLDDTRQVMLSAAPGRHWIYPRCATPPAAWSWSATRST